MESSPLPSMEKWFFLTQSMNGVIDLAPVDDFIRFFLALSLHSGSFHRFHAGGERLTGVATHLYGAFLGTGDVGVCTSGTLRSSSSSPLMENFNLSLSFFFRPNCGLFVCVFLPTCVDSRPLVIQSKSIGFTDEVSAFSTTLCPLL